MTDAGVNRVTALITAEAIIAGFMIAYGAVNGQLLTQWAAYEDLHPGAYPPGALVITTFLAGIGIYTIVLTCLVSIPLLFKSTNPECRGSYEAGYDLFGLALLASATFTVSSAFSIWHFTIASDHVPFSCIPVNPVAHLALGFFVLYTGILAVVLTQGLRRRIQILAGTHRLFWILLAVLVVEVIVIASCSQSCLLEIWNTI